VEELERVVAATDANAKAADARNKPLVARSRELREQMSEFTKRQREIGVSPGIRGKAGENLNASRSKQRRQQANMCGHKPTRSTIKVSWRNSEWQ